MSAENAFALELRGISRAFGPLLANDEVDLSVARGTVHAIVGENGAGKSTLMRIAYGELRADSGRITIQGQEIPRQRHTPLLAIRQGLGMVHQHFMLVKPMTVVENVVLGQEPLRQGRIDFGQAAARVKELSGKFGLELDPLARVEDLAVGQQQRVEILKVLWQGCEVLILDEPTAVLTPGEVRHLFEILRGLVRDGRTVVLITHKLDEVCAIADRVTVMRRGQVVAELDGHSASPEAMASAMVGRPVLLKVERPPLRLVEGGPVLRLEGVHVARREGVEAVAGVSFAVRGGEIVGIAGVEGNGQSELCEAIVGLRPCSAGRILLGGGDLAGWPVMARYHDGLAHIPEDRQQRGVVLDFSVAENLILGRQGEFTRWFGLDAPRIRSEAERCIAEFDLRPAEPTALTSGLSGGNQQKLIVARELSRPLARLLVCVQPTRGVDIGAVEQIYQNLLSVRERGWGVLLSSVDLSELTALSDRLLVFYRGRVVCELEASELSAADAHERIGALMTGAVEGTA